MPKKPRPQEIETGDGSIETTFDVTAASEDITFLGFLYRSTKTDNELEGLFSWTCSACSSANRDIAIVKPQQAFLTHWICAHCGRETVVQFRSRATADWIAEHTLATTGQTFCDIAQADSVPAEADNDDSKKEKSRTGGQKAFAWVAIPALVGIIVLGLSDWRRVYLHSVLGDAHQTEQVARGPAVRLEGYWFNKERGLTQYFSQIDPISQTGTYVLISRKDNRRNEARFKIVHEEKTGEQLVIRELNEKTDGTMSDAGVQAAAREATLYVAKDNQSLIWVNIRDGKPVITNFRRAGKIRFP